MLAALTFQYPQALPWVILLVAILTLLILLLYPPQLRQMRRCWRWMLPALRIFTVTMIAFSMLRPVITRARVAAERAPVVIILDNSHSMSVTDSARTPAEWVGIAAALGGLPAEARDKEIDTVQADCDRLSAQADDVTRARAELDYARLSGRGADTAQARLDQTVTDLQSIAHDAATKASAITRANPLGRTLAYLEKIPVGVDRDNWLDHIRDRARAAAADAEQARFASDARLYRTDAKIRDACLPLQSLSRLQLAESAAEDTDHGLAVRLGPETSVLGYAISDQVTPIAPGHAVEANGSISNLSGGLRAVLESLQAAPPRAVVLFSDGRQIAGDTDPATLTALQGVPIYTVGIAARAGLKDLSITNVQVNSDAIVGEHFNLTAELRAIGLRGLTTQLKITGAGPDESRQVTFPDERTVTVSFDRVFTTAGLQPITLELDHAPDEESFENNVAQRWVNVSKKSKSTPTSRPATRPSIEAEMSDITGDEPWLRRLAEASGGRFFRMDQVDLLPKRLNEIRDDANHPMVISLWDGPYLFVIVLGCLATEWGLRKRLGMA